MRWTRRDQWHVTLRFLGEIVEPEDISERLSRTFTGVGSAVAVAGPTVERLGRGALVIPVAGLDALAATASEATRDVGEAQPDRDFNGHLTIARLKRHGRPQPLVGEPFAARWTVTEIELIRSHLSNSGAHYETLTTIPLADV